MDRSIRDLLEEDEAELAHRIGEVERVLQRKYGVIKLSGGEADVALLQRGLDDGVLSARTAGQLQNVGLALASVAVNTLGLRWVMVEDEYGTDPALQDPETEDLFHALTLVTSGAEEGRVELAGLLRSLQRRDQELRQAS